MSPAPSPPVFVLGTGRCGSTLLHELLAHHPATAWISNIDDRLARLSPATALAPRAFRSLPPATTTKGRIRLAPSEGYAILERRASPLLVDPCRDLLYHDAQPWIVNRMTDLVDEVRHRQQAGIFIHKFTGWPRVGFLRAAFPDARFVHVVRDGRAVAASWMRTPWWRGHLGPEGWHFGPLTPTEEAMWHASGRSFTVLAALGWKRLADAFEASAKDALTHDAAWLDVRFEDLTGPDHRHLLEVVSEVCGLDDPTPVIAAAGRYGLDAQRNDGYLRDWHATERQLVERAIGPTLARWGYG